MNSELCSQKHCLIFLNEITQWMLPGEFKMDNYSLVLRMDMYDILMNRFFRIKGTTLVQWNLSIVVTVSITHLLIVATTLGRSCTNPATVQNDL